MEFTFQTKITESKGAINTAAKIADILAKSEVSFSTLKDSEGVPGIWVKFPDQEKPKLVAHTEDGIRENELFFRVKKAGWWVVYAANPFRHGEELYLFNHLTDAAEELVTEWIDNLCEEYQRRLDADMIPA